jgi:hypothetical protein
LPGATPEASVTSRHLPAGRHHTRPHSSHRFSGTLVIETKRSADMKSMIRLTEAEIDQLSRLVGDLAAAVTATLITTFFVALAVLLLVRVVRSWSGNRTALAGVVRRVAVFTLCLAAPLQWFNWRTPPGATRSAAHTDWITVACMLVIPLLLLAWGLGALFRMNRRSRPPHARWPR